MRLVDKVTRLSCDQQSIDVLPLCKDFTIELNTASFFGRLLNLLGDQEGEETSAVNFARDAMAIFQHFKPAQIAVPNIVASEFTNQLPY